MFRRLPDQRKKVSSWGAVLVWSVVIFLTIPFARKIQQFFEHALGTGVYLTAAGIVGVFFAVVVLIFLLRRPAQYIRKRLVWLIVILAASVWVMQSQLQTPAEALHFFEYGILGFLLFRAWSHDVRDWLIYPIAAISLVMIASVDEFIQWMVPGRYWDFRDIRLNMMAGVIVQAFIARVIKPSAIGPTFKPRSIRLLCVTSWLTLLMLGFAIANTPTRVDLYATRIPFLQFLSNNESVMSEFGHRHTDPEIGTFYSRFKMAELQRIDLERGAEAGETIRRYKEFADYREFLQTFTSSVDPFLHEMRVHLHRRDHYYSTAWQYEEKDPGRFTYHLTVALRENQLLEKYFPSVLVASENVLSADKREQLVAFANLGLAYTSPVSDHLVTTATEMEIWLVILVLSAGFAFVYVRYGRESSPVREQ